MKKKERRKLKEFARSEQWKNTPEVVQNDFTKKFIFNNRLTDKERREVATILLRKTK